MNSRYSGPAFEMARQQVHVFAHCLAIAEDERDRLLFPERAIVVSRPIHRDDRPARAFTTSESRPGSASRPLGRPS